MPDEPTYPTDAMVEIATRRANQCLAAIGREATKGKKGWMPPVFSPDQILREMILGALMDAEAQRRDAEAKPHG